MRPLFRILAVPVLILLPLAGIASENPTTTPIDKVGWLAGSWELSSGTRTVHEQWMEPLGGSMLGMGRTVRDSKTVEFEFVRIEEQDGLLVYIAQPSGQKQASFRQTELTDSLVVFSNPEHDFPQSVRYQRLPDGTILARVEGTIDGKPRKIDFPYTPRRPKDHH